MLFDSLARALPSLKLLQSLHLELWPCSLWAGHNDLNLAEFIAAMLPVLLAISRCLKAWPLPLLFDFKFKVEEWEISVGRFSHALGLPEEAKTWDNKTTLDFFRMQQLKMTAFASGLHARLGGASHVSLLNEQMLMIIADEVLGGWSLRTETQQQRQISDSAALPT